MPSPEDLHAGADVYSADGHKLGDLRRVVLRRSDLTATHVVVDIGFLRSGHKLWEGGLGLDYDRVVPVSAIGRASDKRVDLSMSAAEFKEAPEYTAEVFEAPQDIEPGEFDILDVVLPAERVGNAIANASTFWLWEKLNKPLGSVDIKEGTPVWRRQPHEKLGEVDRLLFDAEGKMRAFVIRRGFLLKRDVVLPVRYVTELLDDLVRVDIPDEHLDALKAYEG
jgi:uncharacterized protein YrrD